MVTITRTPRQAATPQPSEPPAPSGVRRGPNERRRFVAFGYLSPTIVLLIVLMATPVAMVVGYSIFDNVITNRDPQVVGFANYVEIVTDPAFWQAGRNTAVFTVVSVAAHMVLGLTFAMLLNTELIGRRLRAAFRVVLVLPWLFTIAIVAVLWRMLLDPRGVVNYLLNTVGIDVGLTDWLGNPALALGAVTVINIWAGYPFFMISLLAGLQGIPAELHEAAKVDGASPVQRFRNVTLPQLRPLLISLGLLDVIWTTQQFPLIWMTTGGGPMGATEVLSTYTYKLAFSRYEFALASTSAVVILLASLVLAIFYARSQKMKD